MLPDTFFGCLTILGYNGGGFILFFEKETMVVEYKCLNACERSKKLTIPTAFLLANRELYHYH